MGEGFEVSHDDPDGIAAAMARATRGVPARLRHGHVVADIVPVTSDERDEQPDPAATDRPDLRHGEIVRAHAEKFGAPTLEHFRQVYREAGWDWPGETYIRTHHVVADGS